MSWTAFVHYRGMPDSTRTGPAPAITRTHLNYSNDFPCTVATLEDPAQRVAVGREMRLRTLQLLFFLQNVLGHRDWSVADDEGFDTPYNRAEIAAWIRDRPEMEPFRAVLHHFSIIPYVRESRRLVGLHTLRAAEISRGPGKSPQQFATTVSLGDYRLDLHGGRTAADLELDLDRLADLEDAQPGRAGPFAIPFESLIPERIDGFLPAEKNFSQTRLVNGATRMQPHTLNLGQAVGALAALAVRHGVPPRRIDPVLVQHAVLAAHSTLNITPLQDVPQENADWPAIQLLSIRGLLPLESGRFHPQRPLSPREMAAALAALGGPPAAGRTDDAPEVPRAAFAQALATAFRSEVEVAFSSPAADADRPITRSEAAQVLADCLELRALGRLRGAPRTLRWASVRPASSPIAADTPLDRQLQRLLAAGIISSVDYWREHAVAERDCDGTRVAELLSQAARVFEPDASTRTAAEVLLRARVIAAPDYWVKNAVPGGNCAGKNVATVIRNLAASEAIAQRALPPPSPRDTHSGPR